MSGVPVMELFAKLGLDVDEGAFNAATAAIGGIQKGLLAVGAAFAGMGVAFAAALKRTANAGDHIDELSQQVGVNAQELQRMAYGAQFSSVSVDDLAQAMGYLAKSGVKDLRGGMLQLADQFSKMPNGGAKTRIALEKLGRSGKALIPFLNEGREKLAEFAAEADASGYVMGEQLVKDSAAFNDSLDRLGGALTGLRNSIAGPFLSVVGDLIDKVRVWLVLNREIIASNFRAVVTVTGRALKILGAILSPVVKLMGWFFESTIRTRFALLALYGVLVTKIAAALLSNATLTNLACAAAFSWGQGTFAAGLKAAAGVLLSQLAWIALLAVVGLVIEDIYVALTGGRSFFGEWTKFLKEDPTDSPFMRGLKAVLRAITDIDDVARSLADKFNKTAVGQALNAHVADGFERAKHGQLTAQEKANGAFGYRADRPDELILPANRTGTPGVGSSTPAFIRASTDFPVAGGAPLLRRGADAALPTLNIGGITVNAPGGDPDAVTSATEKAIRNVLRGEYSKSFVQVD